MYSVVIKYSPITWDKRQSVTRMDYDLTAYKNEEYKQIAYEANVAMDTEHSNLQVVRVQNIHDLGQCLIKQQKLLVENPGQAFYQGRRYIVISQNYLNEALEYNLDYRRCGLSQLKFNTKVSPINTNNVLVVVQTIIKNQDQDSIVPEYSDEFYIEYYVKLDV
ncbi:unnamed protein product [Brassicogethes aeneus]|uniref:Uncharacterized protein n=1 Tax=Brassicogethes aeneus TaxID=1431903 RepID=A0A9P0FDT5_BRAAE|nr:unnamed protein product [Brassicogethes aeneus]